MLAFATFAYIVGGKVENLAVFKPDEYDVANYIAQATHGDNAMAVDVSYIPVEIGDSYEDGVFYRFVDGHMIEVVPYETESNRISVLESKGVETSESLNNIELALVELYESEG